MSVYKRCTTCRARTTSDSHRQRCNASGYSWAFMADIGRDVDGKRGRVQRSGFETKREAERAERELLSNVDGGTYVERTEVTVGEYLIGEWLPATAPPRVAHQTWTKRRQILTCYVVPRVGRLPLQDLNAAHVSRMYSELLTRGRADGKGLTPTTVHDVHRVLRKALADAQRWGLVERNATDQADTPSARSVQAARRAAMTPWTSEELRTFLEATESHRFGTVFALAASTGLRRSELLGLRWADIDLDAATLTVRQTLVPGPDGYVLRDEQKTSGSARTIHLDARTVSLLKTRRATQSAQRLAAGSAWVDGMLVLTDELGRPLSPPAVSQAFRRAVAEVGLPHIRFHDVRHTHATLLLRAGINPKVVSERLGHSSVAFTLDTYSHVMPGMQPEAAEAFSTLVFGAEG